MIQFWKGTSAEYTTLKSNNKLGADWLYFCTDGKIYLGTNTNPVADYSAGDIGSINSALQAINTLISGLQAEDGAIRAELQDEIKRIEEWAQGRLDTKAPIASPALTGTPTAPTAGATTNTTQIATTAFVQTVAGNKASAAQTAAVNTAAADATSKADAAKAAAISAAATDAASKYATITAVTNAQNKANDAYTLADAAQTAAEVEAAITAKGYLTTSSASSTYLTKDSASSTYATKTALAATETKAAAAKTAIDAFLKDADATTDAIDTLKEIQTQLDSGEASAASLLSEINGIKNGTTTVGKAAALEVTAAVGGNTQPVYIDANGKPQTIGYTIAKSVPSDAKFTDTNTKVTSAANHYTPAADTNSALSPDASSTTAATWGSTSLVTGVNLSRDAKGHVVGLTLDSIQMPANPNTDTHYSSKNIVGASATAYANAAVNTTNANGVYLNHIESNSNTPTSSHKITGAGNVKVTSDSNGHITITGTDKDTHYTAVPHIGTSTSTSNQTTTNTTTYINIVENSARSGGVRVTGSNGITVSGASGTLTIDASTLAGALTWKTGTSF